MKFASIEEDDAIELRKQLPPELQLALLDICEELTRKPLNHDHRVQTLGRDTRVYTHPSPKFEITYRLDLEKKIVHFTHFGLPLLRVPKPMFISYAHADKKYLDELQKFLILLSRDPEELSEIWSDRDLEAGDDWEEEIQKAMKSAKAAILLVSQDFLFSEYITKKELPFLIESWKHKKLDLLWIAVRTSTYEDTELRQIEAVNEPEKPLDSLRKPEREKALKTVYQRVKKLLQK